MHNKKIFILLPDGIGLRNFAYSHFHELGQKEGFEPVFWNNTPFDLKTLGYEEVKIHRAKTHPLTDIYKNARKHIELNLNIQKSGNSVYDAYRFPFSYKNLKSSLKSMTTRVIIAAHSSGKGLEKVREKIQQQERKTDFYRDSLATLQKEKPAMVFCTNQRPVLAIAPLLAARDLGIPTASFIFSWDNLPKATMVVEADYYFVWSDHMKRELLYYYDYIRPEQVFVTGTPQFESHANKATIQSKQAFFEANGLDCAKKYICYSGDDITTSPDDQQYLADTAKAVRTLNTKGHNLGILFRRCPVDFSSRYDSVLETNKDLIVNLPPLWKKIGEGWNTILPTKEDVALQQNTIFHTEMVVNLGSSMVFDYVCYDKPCCFVNYDTERTAGSNSSVKKIYNYVHFRSMPHKNAVIWLDSPEEIADRIETGLLNPESNVAAAKEWFDVINEKPIENASARIWEAIRNIIR